MCINRSNISSDLAAGKTLQDNMFFADGFLANIPACDQTADRRRVKSILVLRT